MMLATSPASSPLLGELTAPGDKSISHRALIFACLARGQSRITGLLDSEESFLVILHFHNAAGIRIGAVNFTVRGRSLAEAVFLKQVCARITRAFDERIHRGLEDLGAILH